jgi:Na+/H+ antiporter NhaD/arsenite permease-like protein
VRYFLRARTRFASAHYLINENPSVAEIPRTTHRLEGSGETDMQTIQWLTLIVFAVTIAAVVVNKLDATVAALLGVAIMVWMGTMTEVEAAQLVDWNVMAILVGIWIMAGYFGRSGVPSWLSLQSLKLSGGRPGLLVLVLSMLTGLLSMFIDNVVCILMMAPVALPLARALGIPATPLVLMIGFSANFMGTALLLGDLPPQMLHSVAGAEFFDFIWQFGRPSSFPILMTSFTITLAFMYLYGFRRIAKPATAEGTAGIKSDIQDPLFAFIAVGMFLLTVFAMAMREYLGVKLGFIAITGAVALVFIVEIMGDRLKGAPSFEHIVQELDWRAVFFYIALFALVGGLEKTHILDMMANWMRPIFAQNYALGATILYWVTIPIVGIVEHDAYILTFLNTIKELGAQGVPPWPLWWVVLWAGTLGSNLTVAGAPALYVALRIAEKEEDRKVSLREFLSWSIPFCLVSAFITYVLAMLIWVLPYAGQVAVPVTPG